MVECIELLWVDVKPRSDLPWAGLKPRCEMGWLELYWSREVILFEMKPRCDLERDGVAWSEAEEWSVVI